MKRIVRPPKKTGKITRAQARRAVRAARLDKLTGKADTDGPDPWEHQPNQGENQWTLAD